MVITKTTQSISSSSSSSERARERAYLHVPVNNVHLMTVVDALKDLLHAVTATNNDTRT